MIPDYFEPLMAYRCWNVFPNGLLVGQAHSEPWPPFEPFVGRCGCATSADHVCNGQYQPAPVFTCDCGIHALKSSVDAEMRIVNDRYAISFSSSPYAPPGRIWGSVKLWGRIIEHEIGYRAQFAYPSALFCENKELAAVVAALYGVPCEFKVLPLQTEPEYAISSVSVWYPFGSLAGTVYFDFGTLSDHPPTTAPSDAPKPLANLPAVGASRWQKKQAANTVRPRRNGFRDRAK